MAFRRDRALKFGFSTALMLVLSALFFVFAADSARADVIPSTAAVFAQEVQDSPYQPPENEEIEPPPWLAPLGPIASLPLWAVAAVVSASLAGLVIVVPMAARWIWTLGPDNDPEE